MSTFKHLSYDEWIELNPDVLLQEEDCPECNGEGESHCIHCGSIIECEACDGTGKTQSAKDEYEKQKKHDDEVMKKYLTAVTA